MSNEKETPISREMEISNKLIESLEHAVQRLESKVESCLSPQIKNTGTKEQNPPSTSNPESPFTERLKCLNIRIDICRNQINLISDHLEI